MNKNYYAIIPANIRYDTELSPNSKLLYGEITALCNEKGYCWATNDYFAELYGVSKVSISKWINDLVNKGYLQSDLIYKEGTKQILYRYLRIVNDPIKEKFNTPIKEKFKDNNTCFNNTSNNTFNISSNKFADASFEMLTVNYLISQILRLNPNFKEPDKQKWCIHIDRMKRIDSRTEEDIKRVIKYATEDPFWQKNILSTQKFREKFDQLYIQMNNKNKPSKGKQSFDDFKRELEEW